jgi:hypothetical protein
VIAPAPVLRRLLLPACLAALAASLSPSPSAAAQDAPAGPQYADKIVAIVEGVPITLHELELACRLHAEYHDLPKGDSLERQEFRRQVLERGITDPRSGDKELSLITKLVLLQKAKEQKVELTSQDEERIQQEISHTAERQPGGMDGLRQALDQLGVPYDYFVARKRENLLITKLLLTTVSREIFITPAEVRRHYEEHRAEYERPGELRLRQIVIYLDPEEDAPQVPAAIKPLLQAKTWDARAFAADLRRRIAAGELPFDQAASQYSMDYDPTPEKVFPVDRPVPLRAPLPARVARMRAGEVSDVIEVPRGRTVDLYILWLVDRKERGVLPLEEVQDEIELTLKDQIWAQRRDAFIERVRGEAHVEVYLDPGK